MNARSTTLLILVLLLAGLLVGGCRNGSPESDAAGSELTAYHDLRSPEQYFDLIPAGAMDWLKRSSGLANLHKDEYVSAIIKLQEGGPDAVSSEEWSLIMAVSWYAYAVQARAVRYEVVQWDASCRILTDGIVEEVYRLLHDEQWPISTVPVLSAQRRQAGNQAGLVAEPCLPVEADPAPSFCPTPEPTNQHIEIIEVNAAGTKGSSTRWTEQGDEWLCEQDDDVEGLWAVPLRLFVDDGFLHAVPVGTETIQGRDTYKSHGAAEAGDSSEQANYYWMDAETLLPVRYEYELRDLCRRGGTKQVKILEVNGEVDIRPPSIDVTCK